MDKWNQVLKGVAAIILSFVVGMALGMAGGCYEFPEYYQMNAVCEIGELRCHNNWQQSCVNGAWQDDVDCGAMTCAAVVIDDISKLRCL